MHRGSETKRSTAGCRVPGYKGVMCERCCWPADSHPPTPPPPPTHPRTPPPPLPTTHRSVYAGMRRAWMPASTPSQSLGPALPTAALQQVNWPAPWCPRPCQQAFWNRPGSNALAWPSAAHSCLHGCGICWLPLGTLLPSRMSINYSPANIALPQGRATSSSSRRRRRRASRQHLTRQSSSSSKTR